jgi:hypothetical protein
MKWIVALSLLVFVGHTLAVKKVDRGVFVSARELAARCQAMKDIFGENWEEAHLLQGPTGVNMAPIGRCMGYVEGVADEFRERGHYNPRQSSEGRGGLSILIVMFLKRVAEHPEEADLAASTVLHEADNDALRSCEDCGFGVFVHP